MDIKTGMRLLKKSGIDGRLIKDIHISEYDKNRGGVIYNSMKHDVVGAYIACPCSQSCCKKRKSRTKWNACVHRRREEKMTRKKLHSHHR